MDEHKVERTDEGDAIVLKTDAYRLAITNDNFAFLTDISTGPAAGCTCHLREMWDIQNLRALLDEAEKVLKERELGDEANTDDDLLPPITEEFCEAMDVAWADGVGVGLSEAIRRWRDGKLIIPQIARLIDESDWPLPDRLNRAHKAFMLDWEGEGYEGRHAPKYPPRGNWVHHVDFYHDGTIGIDRYGQDVRLYDPTETSKRRLKNTIDRLCWSWRPPTKIDPIHEIVSNRAMAPMRRFS